MRQQPEYDYLDCMVDLLQRLEFIAWRMDSVEENDAAIQHDYALISMSFRKCVELVAFSSLVAHKETYSQAHSDFERHRNAKRMMENLERIHPDFYPVPFECRTDARNRLEGFEVVESG